MSRRVIDSMDGMYVVCVECVQSKNRSKVIKAYQHKGGNAGRTKQKLTISELGGGEKITGRSA